MFEILTHNVRRIFFLGLLFSVTFTYAQQDLVDLSYFEGRKYFVLRSGRAKMILQVDKAELGPSVSWMLFDAEHPKQMISKKNAINYHPEEGFSSSAVGIRMKNYDFYAFGSNHKVRWIVRDEIPSVEILWWAGGIKIREVITPVPGLNLFKRTISAESGLVDSDTIHLVFSDLCRPSLIKDNAVIFDREKIRFALTVEKREGIDYVRKESRLVVGPIVLAPGETQTVETCIGVDFQDKGAENYFSEIVSLTDKIDEMVLTKSKEFYFRNKIETGDTVVQLLFDACSYALPGFVSEEGRMAAGIFEYGGQWVRDASQTVLGLVSVGQFELSRAALEYMLQNMITENGTTMISGGFDQPDMEQFDQMGEFLHALKWYLNWTGDDTMLKKYRQKIVAMIERPLNGVFRDSTGMVHNRREYWERKFDDAYELAYQTWVIQGLRDAACISHYLGVPDMADVWKTKANEIEAAFLYHPTKRLVHDSGYLIKRRNVDGEIADIIYDKSGIPGVSGSPAQVEKTSRLMPDATMALPISLKIIDPHSSVSKKTLDELEKLWNARWTYGGYDRYNTSSQGDQPGPWTFATAFIMRANHIAGDLQRSRRSLSWLCSLPAGQTGAWHEEIPIIASHQSGLMPWTAAEISSFIIRDVIGVQFNAENRLIINPDLFEGTSPVSVRMKFREDWINLHINGSGKIAYGMVNGEKTEPTEDGFLMLPEDFEGGDIYIRLH